MGDVAVLDPDSDIISEDIILDLTEEAPEESEEAADDAPDARDEARDDAPEAPGPIAEVTLDSRRALESRSKLSKTHISRFRRTQMQ